MPFALCFTGLSGCGKSTLANYLSEYLKARKVPTQIIDGDILRKELGNLFGYTFEDRMKQNRVVRVLAKYLLQNNINVIISIVAPYTEMRLNMRKCLGESYIQCYLMCPVDICAQRDVKGFYKLAHQGKLNNLNGTNEKFEIPLDSEIEIDTSIMNVEKSAAIILEYLRENGYEI